MQCFDIFVGIHTTSLPGVIALIQGYSGTVMRKMHYRSHVCELETRYNLVRYKTSFLP